MSRLALLESDKKLLQEECDELREAMRILENNVNDELKQLDEGSSETISEDTHKALREAKTKHEAIIFCCVIISYFNRVSFLGGTRSIKTKIKGDGAETCANR